MPQHLLHRPAYRPFSSGLYRDFNFLAYFDQRLILLGGTQGIQRLVRVVRGMIAVPGELRVSTMIPAVFKSCNHWNSF